MYLVNFLKSGDEFLKNFLFVNLYMSFYKYNREIYINFNITR